VCETILVESLITCGQDTLILDFSHPYNFNQIKRPNTGLKFKRPNSFRTKNTKKTKFQKI